MRRSQRFAAMDVPTFHQARFPYELLLAAVEFRRRKIVGKSSANSYGSEKEPQWRIYGSRVLSGSLSQLMSTAVPHSSLDYRHSFSSKTISTPTLNTQRPETLLVALTVIQGQRQHGIMDAEP